jgi:hypothetical protein
MEDEIVGYVATNRLSGAYMAEHEDRRKLVRWVKRKARRGTWVDISYHQEGGGIHKVGGFLVTQGVRS